MRVTFKKSNLAQFKQDKTLSEGQLRVRVYYNLLICAHHSFR